MTAKEVVSKDKYSTNDLTESDLTKFTFKLTMPAISVGTTALVAIPMVSTRISWVFLL